MKKQSVVIPVINNEYKVIVCWGNLKSVHKVMKDWQYDYLAEEEHLAKRRGVTFFAENCHPIIALPRFPKTAQEIGTLAHEATHAVINVFQKIEETNYDEVFAHSVGAVVRRVLENK